MFLEDSHPVRLLLRKHTQKEAFFLCSGADFLNGTAPQRFVGLIKGRFCVPLFHIPIFLSLMEAFVAAQNSEPVYPIPRFPPPRTRTRRAPGRLRTGARAVQARAEIRQPPRICGPLIRQSPFVPQGTGSLPRKFVSFRYTGCLLSNLCLWQKAQVELLAFFSGCTLRLLQPTAFDPWLFDVFAWYRQVAKRLEKRHSDLVTEEWLPAFDVSRSSCFLPSVLHI